MNTNNIIQSVSEITSLLGDNQAVVDSITYTVSGHADPYHTRRGPVLSLEIANVNWAVMQAIALSLSQQYDCPVNISRKGEGISWQEFNRSEVTFLEPREVAALKNLSLPFSRFLSTKLRGIIEIPQGVLSSLSIRNTIIGAVSTIKNQINTDYYSRYVVEFPNGAGLQIRFNTPTLTEQEEAYDWVTCNFSPGDEIHWYLGYPFLKRGNQQLRNKQSPYGIANFNIVGKYGCTVLNSVNYAFESTSPFNYIKKNYPLSYESNNSLFIGNENFEVNSKGTVSIQLPCQK